MNAPGSASPQGHQGASAIAVSDIAAWLPNLRTTIVVAPQRAVDYLPRLISPRTAGVPREHRVDALGLLAEAFLRLHESEEAVDAATAACRAARALDPADSRRVIVVTGIAADIAVRTGHADAQSAAIDYYTLITEVDPDNGSLTHQRRLLLLALGLVTAAVYHTDCHAGRNQLDLLRASLAAGPNWPAGLAVITHAASAAQQLCDGQRAASADRSPPMPGGLLHPDVHHPCGDYLADRLTAQPPTHTHEQWAEAATTNAGAADLVSAAAAPPGGSACGSIGGDPR